jgi:hypothetical protein
MMMMMKVKSVPMDGKRVELFFNDKKGHVYPIKELASDAIVFEAEIKKRQAFNAAIDEFKEKLGKQLEKFDFSKEQELIVFDNGLAFDAKESRLGHNANFTSPGNYNFRLDSKHFKG